MIPLWDQRQCHRLLIQPRDLLYEFVRAQGVVDGLCLRVKRSNGYLFHRKEPVYSGSC